MDEFDYSGGHMPDKSELAILLVLVVVTGSSLSTGLMSLAAYAQIGPRVGEIIVFNPRNGPYYWEQPGIRAVRMPVDDLSASWPRPVCILMPPVMAAAS
ncbi:MAG: hypothetical protein EXR07_09985 [Acetobacteraceae bacterium]|nr:hypothetical protein [Acetobacteraceae bacterium]